MPVRNDEELFLDSARATLFLRRLPFWSCRGFSNEVENKSWQISLRSREKLRFNNKVD